MIGRESGALHREMEEQEMKTQKEYKYEIVVEAYTL